MESSPRVLLILFEGLPGTVIESQVLVHAREMARLGIAEFEIWTVAWSGPLYRRSLSVQPHAQDLAGCTVRVLRGVRPAVPFSTLFNALILGVCLLRHRSSFDVVHARTDYGAVVGTLLKRWRRFVLVWDCRGDAVAEFSERFPANSPVRKIARALRIRILARHRRLAARGCDRAIFVSGALKALAASYMNGKPCRVIPCTASETLFGFDAALRERTRQKLGIRPEERLHVFSGSLAVYQCFEETLALFARVRAADPRARLLILTPEQDEARRRIDARSELGNVLLRGATISEMNSYLNAADAGFMLRKPTAVNRAAFPTKFAEYCLTGLRIIMTPAVPDAYDVAERLGNLVSPAAAEKSTWPEPYDRRQVADNARLRLARTSVAPLYRELYSIVPRDSRKRCHG